LAREKEKKRANFEILGLIEEHPDCSDCVYKNHFLQIDFPCCKGACVKSAGILPPPFLTLPYVPFAPLPPPLTPFPAVSRRTQMPRTERAVSKRPAYFPVPARRRRTTTTPTTITTTTTTRPTTGLWTRGDRADGGSLCRRLMWFVLRFR